MFTNVEQVKELTNYEVTAELIVRAQAIIESVVGKVESEVSDANDLAILGRATAFQTAYMANNYDKVYEQVAFTYKGQSDAALSPDTSMMAPFIAPLAVLALRRLSWARSRSIKTGPTFPTPTFLAWEVN